MTSPRMSDAPSPRGRFGTFGGVFTPSILTILGVVMYMRFGWVTGHAGLGGALLIVLVAHAISIATGLSVSSIATNRTVGAGGAYFMISRALGAPAGAAIGIPLFFGQALSVTFYIVGFTEAVLQLLPPSVQQWVPGWAISTVTNVLLTALAFRSADLAIKAQYFVMAAIAVSLVAFFAGRTPSFPVHVQWFNPSGESFTTVFAVFFPAVTGIMAGVSMSGDLKDPRKSIPRGTMAAIFVGMAIYTAVPVWLALNAKNITLMENVDAMFDIAWWSGFIYLGVWGATLSSALGSILAAPRTLQALAHDGLVPRFLGKGWGTSNEPRIGIIVTFALAQTGILLGSLDAIAPVLTMFFLATYGVTNLACGLQKWAASPSFRPTFRVPAVVSLMGAIACFYVMSIIDMLAMFAALVVCALVFLVTQRRSLSTTYGDARHGIWAALVRSALQRLRRAEFHAENWRPNLVILGGDPEKRSYLLDLGSAIVQDRGIVTYYHLLRGAVADHAASRRTLLEKNDELLARDYPNVFYRVDVFDDVYRGTVAVAQAYGVGSFEANSVMLGWPKKPDREEAYADMLRDLVALDRSLLLVRHHPERAFGEGRTIHVWWGGLQGNGGLMLLLAHLVTATDWWRKAKVDILTIVDGEADAAKADAGLRKLLSTARMEAAPRVIPRQGRPIAAIMHEHSAEADLAIVGFRLPAAGETAAPFFERMNEILSGLPTTVLVHSARSFSGDPVLFDR